jgi:hypothetical protein
LCFRADAGILTAAVVAGAADFLGLTWNGPQRLCATPDFA